MADKYRDFPFDKTLTDIVIKASQWKVKQPPKLALVILPILEEMMDGVVVFALKAKNIPKSRLFNRVSLGFGNTEAKRFGEKGNGVMVFFK